MKTKRELDYGDARDGAITYFNNREENDVIDAYKNSSDMNIGKGIKVLIQQRDSSREELVDSIQDFDKLRDEIITQEKNKSGKGEPKVFVTEVVNERGEKKVTLMVEGKDEDKGEEKGETSDKSEDDDKAKDEEKTESETESSDSDAENTASEEKKQDIDEKIKELENKSKEMERIGEILISNTKSVNDMKGSLMEQSEMAGIIMEARVKYEEAHDALALETAKHMVKKNVLVSKREVLVLQIGRAMDKGEDLTSLQDNLIAINNEIEGLDRNYRQVLPALQAEVSGAYNEFQTTSKEVISEAKADFRNSYKNVRNYSEDGMLESESTDITKNLSRAVFNANFNENILSTGKMGAMTSQTININGKVVRVVSKEYSRGVENSFLDGNVEQLRTGSGKFEYVSKDSNGDFIADNPEVGDALKRIGIQSDDDLTKACTEMEEAKTRHDKEKNSEEQEYPAPSLHIDDND